MLLFPVVFMFNLYTTFLKKYFILFYFGYFFYAQGIITNEILYRSIKKVFDNNNISLNMNMKKSSTYQNNCIKELCTDFKNYYIGCCKPIGTRYINNVMIYNKQFITFLLNKKEMKNYQCNNTILLTNNKLPPLLSVISGKIIPFSMNININDSDIYPPKTCKSIFNGTLHIFGRSSTHNLFHASTSLLFTSLHF